jgi:hypothetical protein
LPRKWDSVAGAEIAADRMVMAGTGRSPVVNARARETQAAESKSSIGDRLAITLGSIEDPFNNLYALRP